MAGWAQCNIYSPSTVCRGEVVFLSTDCPLNGIRHYWLINNQIVSYESSLQHVFNEVGEYTVSFVVERQQFPEIIDPNSNPPQIEGGGGFVNEGASILINVSPSVPTPIILSSSESICSTQTINLSISNPSIGVNYIWSPAPSSTNTWGTIVSFQNISNTTSFQVSAQIGNCVSNAFKTVELERTYIVPINLNPNLYRKAILIGSSSQYNNHFWQTSPQGTDLGNLASNDEFAVYTDGDYFIRHYNSLNDCWAVASSPIKVTINKIPPIVEVYTAPKFGFYNAFIASDDIDYLFQFADYYLVSGINGEERNLPFVNGMSLAVGIRYFLRGRDKESGIWGEAKEFLGYGLSDDGINWINAKTFDGVSNEESSVVSESRSYFDKNGKSLQSQAKIFEEEKILVTQNLKGRYDNEIGSSLPAPVSSSNFSFQSLFVSSQMGGAYSYKDFDFIGVGQENNRIINPLPVSKEVNNSLGWYYSDKNPDKSIPHTNFPYSRIEVYEDGTGETKRTAMQGDFHKLGSGHESHQASFPIRNELNHYFTIRKLFIPTQSSSIVTSASKGIVKMNVDENGKTNFSFADEDGNLIMSARPGNWLVISDQIAQITPENPRQYLYTTSNSSLSQVSANSISLIKMRTEEALLASTTLTNIPVEKGGYIVDGLNGAATQIKHTVGFEDISYNFYDDAGRLVASIAPNGVKHILTNTINSVSDIPFVTTYKYNHKGWLVSITEPDAGTTSYLYRKDGKIRFSQNAEQKLNDRFSYTNYDKLGRPIESGEYIGDTALFKFDGVGSNNLKNYLEFENQAIFTTNQKRDWVISAYDNEDQNFHTETKLSNNQFNQQFIRGAVSFTENENIKTWYSYDELGRVVWVAQKPKNLNRAFVMEYTYDFLGSVISTVTKSFNNQGLLLTDEVFYHHYVYDKDKRLKEVYTSTDGVHKNIQARYYYYLHGPLKRIELANTLQGIDFVYNINGWLTGINLDKENNDPGEDGQPGAHANFKPDAFKLALDYYESSATVTNLPISSITEPEVFHGLKKSHDYLLDKKPNTVFSASTFKSQAEKYLITKAETKDNENDFLITTPKHIEEEFILNTIDEVTHSLETLDETISVNEQYASLDFHAGILNVNEGLVPDAIEYEVLKQFYDALGGSGWKTKTNWPTGATSTWPAVVKNDVFKNWFGVTVTNGDITALSYNNNTLVGNIPSSISQLSSLVTLTIIYSTGVTGSIPVTLGSLPNLVTCNISRNALTGSIPSELFNAPKLQVLDLSYNNLTGSIPNEVGNAVNLVNFILAVNKLNGSIPSSIGTLTKLKQIQFGSNMFDGTIPSSLGSLSQLDILLLNDNKLTGTIPVEFGNLLNLRILSLKSNLLTGEIPITIGNLTKLETLNFQNNQLTGPIPVEIGGLTKLTTLWLHVNKLSGEIPVSVGNLTNLTSLYLDTNLLTGSIPKEIGDLTKLTLLYLHANQLNGVIPPNLGQLTALRILSLSNNKLTGNIPESFKNLIKLESLSVHTNLLSGELPSGLFDLLTSLSSINIQSNKFSGSFPSLSNQTKLTSITANNNEFTNFPAYLDNNPQLVFLYLHYNRLRSVPNLANHPNKANLRINYQYNFLLPGNLEALYTGLNTHAFKSLATLPQNVEGRVTGLPSGSDLNISFSDFSSNNTVSWEKLIGTTWTDVSAQDQSTSRNIFLIANANSSHTGKYRFKVTNPKFTSPFIGGVTEIVLTDALPVGEPNALYNGLITSARWQTAQVYGSSDGSLSGRYAYTYDDKYQIKDASMTPITADLSYYQNTTSNTYRVTGLDYDPNGNIKALRRYNKEGLYQHNFTYSYKNKTNQLASVSGYSDYTYNAIGQLLNENSKSDDYQDKFIAYDVSGKVRQVYGIRQTQQGQPNVGGSLPTTTTNLPIPNGYEILVENLYDDKGFRLAKLDYEKNLTTWYIRDASGTLVYTYEQKYGSDAVLTEIPVYGSGKIGVYYPQENGTVAYELTDHLGNVRAVIKKQVTEYIATMENTGVYDITNPRVQELQAFENIEKTEVRDTRFNHTPLPTAERAAYLNWINGMAGKTAADKAVGPAISLKVDKLDTLKIETWVRYQRQDVFNNNIGLTTLASILGGTYAYNGLFEGTLPNAVATEFSDALIGGGFFSDNDNTKPYAYLNYIIFDNQMNPVASDWIRVTEEAAFWPGEEGLPTKKPARLAFEEPIIVNTSGYIYIWVSNNSENSKVWFDDLTVRHSQQILSQATDYGVWGEVMREQKATPYEEFRYGYQGQFAEKDEETGWNHFELREYDAVIGRTITTDPANQFKSSYVWVGNNPVNGTDPNGGFSPIYDSNGNFLGTDDQGFKGDILIFDDPSKFIQGMKHTEALSLGKLIGDAGLTGEAASNIFNHIVGVYKEFNLNFLHNGSFSANTGSFDSDFNDPSPGFYEGRTRHKGVGTNFYQSADWGEIKVSFDWRGKGKGTILSSVENVVNALGVHEYQAHGRLNLKHPKDDFMIMNLQKRHWSWENTTPRFKQFFINEIFPK